MSKAAATTSIAPARAAKAGAIPGDGVRRFELTPHNCFACGTLNASGMQLAIHVERDRSWTNLLLDRRFEGWEGIAHGGILCTVLDEVMAWALVGQENWGLTARLSVDFKKPVRVGQSLHAEGWVFRARRRIVEARGRIIDGASGEVLATGEALYVAADPARKRELQERYGFRFIDGNDGDGTAPGTAAGARAGTPAGTRAGTPAGTRAGTTAGDGR
jgi:acyl-coenzyme A thioesterase PaaI-like protein